MVSKNSRNGLILSPALMGTVLIFTVFSSHVSSSAADAISLCAASVVPSLFPFMVLSSLAVSAASRVKYPTVRWTVIILLGLLCGLPVGSGAVGRGVDEGHLSHSRAEFIPILFATAGPAFIVEIVGRSFWGSSTLGWMFYFCQILSSAFVFGVLSLFVGHNGQIFSTNTKNPSHPPSDLSGGFEKLCRAFTSAVGNSAVTVIRICGFIVFFRVICDLFSTLFHSPYIYAVLASFLEFTSGTAAAASLSGNVGIFLCGASIGFSGLSVIAQCGEILSHSSVSVKFLFLGKLIASPICGVLSLLIYSLLEISTSVFVSTASASVFPSVVSATMLIVSLGFKIISPKNHTINLPQ